jgi:formiminotetrahydrofolate cyclodeaminase
MFFQIKHILLVSLLIRGLSVSAQQADNVWDMSVKTIIDSTAKRKPLITGGCLMITTAGMHTSLAIMAIETSAGKTINQTVKDFLTKQSHKLRVNMDSLNGFAMSDLSIFNNVRYPPNGRQTDSTGAFYAAMVRATGSPLAAAHCIISTLECIDSAAVFCNSVVKSDLLGSAFMLFGCTKALFALMANNINSLTPTDQQVWNDRLKENMSRLVTVLRHIETHPNLN